MVETGTLDVGVFVKSHKAHQKEAENQENLRKRYMQHYELDFYIKYSLFIKCNILIRSE